MHAVPLPPLAQRQKHSGQLYSAVDRTPVFSSCLQFYTLQRTVLPFHQSTLCPHRPCLSISSELGPLDLVCLLIHPSSPHLPTPNRKLVFDWNHTDGWLSQDLRCFLAIKAAPLISPGSQALWSGFWTLEPCRRPGLCHEAADMSVSQLLQLNRKGQLRSTGYGSCCPFLLLSSNFSGKYTLFPLTAKTCQDLKPRPQSPLWSSLPLLILIYPDLSTRAIWVFQSGIKKLIIANV